MPRPPRLPDSAILDLIAELRTRHAALTGTQLREELKRRYGTPGGVSRIYRLLHAATTPAAPPATAVPSSSALAGDMASLHEQLRIALVRAELAEHREEHHQARWAGEIHALREQVHAFKDAAHRLPVLERELQDRSRELASAFFRIADLEEALRRAEK